MVMIVRGTTKNPVSAQRLADYFASHSQYRSTLEGVTDVYMKTYI